MLRDRQFEKIKCTLNIKQKRNKGEEKVCCREVLSSENLHEQKKT
jgi:hypothetical protein